MTNEEYKIMLDASDSVYDNGLKNVPDGYKLEHIFADHNNNGFQAVAFKNETTDEYIISFSGTQNLQDAHADIRLGWDQWAGEVRNEVIKYINDIVVDENASKIHFTGHSLGGALAQYALYEYVSTIRTVEDPTKVLPVQVDITTFNALGGLDGLVQYLPVSNAFRENIITDIDGAHFFVKGDLVSRLGGEHIGGETYAIQPSGVENLNLIDAHLISTVQKIVNLDEFNNVLHQVPLYINIKELQFLSSEFSTFWSIEEGVDNYEAGYRLAYTVLGAISAYMEVLPTNGQLDGLLSAIFKNFKESTNSSIAKGIFTTLENTSFEDLLGDSSVIAQVDNTVKVALIMSMTMVGINEAYNKVFSVLDLPPVWRDRMPDHLIVDFISNYSELLPVIGPLVSFYNIWQFLSDDGALPELSANSFEIQEGQADVMTLTLSEAQDRELAVLVKVHDSERLILTGDNIRIIDDTLGKYGVTFPAGTTQIDIDVEHLMYGDIANPDGEIDFYLVPLDEIHGALNNAGQSTVTLTLTEYELPADETPFIDNTIQGDLEWMDFDASEDGIQVHYDDLGNPVRNPDMPKIMDDTLYGSVDNDWFISGAGEDIIHAKGGDDHIQSGDDQDIVDGEDGDDLIEGGAGTDILFGGEDNDQLFANEVVPLEDMLDTDDIDVENTRDWLSGGNGDDLLVGSHGQNGLAGGDGKDTIYAGAGNDYIIGDANSVAQAFDWQANVINNETIFEPVFGEINPLQGEQDIIYAGGGNDQAWGQWGNDIIYGQGGEDTLYGGEDEDVIDGGNDNDFLYGDRGMDIEYHGDDLLKGGQGDDQLVGHGGKPMDTYWFNSFLYF